MINFLSLVENNPFFSLFLCAVSKCFDNYNQKMKKRTFLLGLVVCTTMAVFAQENQAKQNDNLGIHPWKSPEYAGKQGSWSISVEAGTTMFTGDLTQSFKNLFPIGHWRPTLGVGVEYSINPVWGAALHYNYAPYYAKYNLDSQTELSGVMNSIELLATIDLMDLWFPKRPKNIFSFYLLAGGGIGFFNCELSNPNGLQSGGLTSYEGKEFGTSAGAKRTSNKDITGIIPLGFAIEFNISRMFAIGAKGMYHLHTQDNLDSWVFSEPIRGGTTNDIMEYMTVNFRWKIPSRKADHKRNWRDPKPMFTPYDNMNYNQRNNQPDTVVVVYKPQPDTIYIAAPQQQPEKVTGRQAAAMPTAAPASSAYFDNNKNKLTDDALIAIHSIAMQMQADTTLYLEIRGYCDNTGSKAYNEKLSRQRAEIAKNELVTIWKIAPERIIANGYGIIAEPPKTYKPNRRVDFRFISAEEAETLKNEQVQARENCVSADETRTYSQFIATEKIKQDETLSGLAERFYGQPLFWVYIYEANQETIQNPDNITTDMEIKIPVLPQELADSSNPACIEYAKQLRERYTQQQ